MMQRDVEKLIYNYYLTQALLVKRDGTIVTRKHNQIVATITEGDTVETVNRILHAFDMGVQYNIKDTKDN